MGAQLIKEAATKTNDAAGDGTTTATILTHMMVREGMRVVTAGVDPMALKRGVDKGVAAMVAELERLSVAVDTQEQIAQVASISANDGDIGQMLADVMDHVGRDGVITVEEGKGVESETEYVDG